MFKIDEVISVWNINLIIFFLQISDCGMVLEEQPHKVCEAMQLFLQGLGYNKFTGS